MSEGTGEDLHFLRRAVSLAERGRGFTHPNPVVGCVLVVDGAVVGEGFHARFGAPHAEVEALGAAGDRARGATAYVSLEPCDHHGKTGPCTRALRQAGVARVVFGGADPGPGQGGADTLRSWGMTVDGPLFSTAAARAHNPAFFRVHGDRRPYVALKLAMSLDGRIAQAPGHRTRLTGPESAARVHALRREFDGIMVGSTTVAVDDPLLTVRDSRPVPRPPARVVVDSSLRTSPDARLFDDPPPVFIFCRSDAQDGRIQELTAAGARVRPVSAGTGGLDMGSVLEALWDEGVKAVLCEGGGRLATSLLQEDRAQRVYLFVAPVVLGPRGVPAFPGPVPGPTGHGVEEWDWEGWTRLVRAETFGADVLAVWDRAPAP